MRNNPKFGHNKEFFKQFSKFANTEKMRRFWKTHKPLFYKNFTSKPYQSFFILRHADEFTEEIDKWTEAGDKFFANFKAKDAFP